METIENLLNDEEKEAFKELTSNFKYLDKKILKYHESASKLLHLADFNIKEKAMVAGNIVQSFLTCLYSEKAVLKKLEEAKNVKMTEHREKYGDKETRRYNTDMELEKTAEIKKITSMISDQKDVVRYLEDTCKNFQQFTFNIKNSCDLMKLDKV